MVTSLWQKKLNHISCTASLLCGDIKKEEKKGTDGVNFEIRQNTKCVLRLILAVSCWRLPGYIELMSITLHAISVPQSTWLPMPALKSTPSLICLWLRDSARSTVYGRRSRNGIVILDGSSTTLHSVDGRSTLHTPNKLITCIRTRCLDRTPAFFNNSVKTNRFR